MFAFLKKDSALVRYITLATVFFFMISCTSQEAPPPDPETLKQLREWAVTDLKPAIDEKRAKEERQRALATKNTTTKKDAAPPKSTADPVADQQLREQTAAVDSTLQAEAGVTLAAFKPVAAEPKPESKKDKKVNKLTAKQKQQKKRLAWDKEKKKKKEARAKKQKEQRAKRLEAIAKANKDRKVCLKKVCPRHIKRYIAENDMVTKFPKSYWFHSKRALHAMSKQELIAWKTQPLMQEQEQRQERRIAATPTPPEVIHNTTLGAGGVAAKGDSPAAWETSNATPDHAALAGQESATFELPFDPENVPVGGYPAKNNLVRSQDITLFADVCNLEEDYPDKWWWLSKQYLRSQTPEQLKAWRKFLKEYPADDVQSD